MDMSGLEGKEVGQVSTHLILLYVVVLDVRNARLVVHVGYER